MCVSSCIPGDIERCNLSRPLSADIRPGPGCSMVDEGVKKSAADGLRGICSLALPSWAVSSSTISTSGERKLCRRMLASLALLGGPRRRNSPGIRGMFGTVVSNSWVSIIRTSDHLRCLGVGHLLSRRVSSCETTDVDVEGWGQAAQIPGIQTSDKEGTTKCPRVEGENQ